ncbi:MAG: DUF2975 domain-containing protein [Clostridia bacterium]|nr:DUF2975 domain-containing protein [Clostridia bacterium]MBR5380895.1 DUF2975 domain-containing protein [Clostridia bacterium]
MKWDLKKSIALSRALIVFFALVLLVMDAGEIVSMIQGDELYRGDMMSPEQRRAASALVVAGSAPAWLALWQLWALMGDVRAGRVFTLGTAKRLRLISWCCFAVGLLCLAGACFLHPSVLVVAAAAALMGLIVRIVKNVIQQGSAMKDELDLTV